MMQENRSQNLRIKIELAQLSDPGRDPSKQVNEDSCGYAETRFGHLCVLCDGMGGHYGGKEASRTAITTIFEMFDQPRGNLSPAQMLKAAIEEAGRRVYVLGGPPDSRARPGSTVVAMLIHDLGLDVAHVGDSRAYIIRSNRIYPLTRDHSMVQGMIDAGMLTEESAMGHPDSNKITRALGMKPEVEVESRPDTMRALSRRPPASIERRSHRFGPGPGYPRRYAPSTRIRAGGSRVQDPRAARQRPWRARQHYRSGYSHLRSCYGRLGEDA